MTDERDRIVVEAVGAMNLAVYQIENGADLAAVKFTLGEALNGKPPARVQICGRGLHRIWLEVDPAAEPSTCPWCEIDRLKALLNAPRGPIDWTLKGAEQPLLAPRNEAS